MTTPTTQTAAPDQTAAKTAPPKADTLFVVDANAKDPNRPRVHDLVLDDGHVIQYPFPAGKKVEMPRPHAIRFGTCDPAFEVYDHDGRKVDLTSTGVKAAEGTVAPVIPAGCCIARFEELTIDSLVNRANAEPGGLKFSKRDGKDALVAFLAEAQAAREAAKAAADDEGIGGKEADDMSAADLERLFDGK